MAKSHSNRVNTVYANCTSSTGISYFRLKKKYNKNNDFSFT